MKQGGETKFVKEPEEETRNYIFQNNKITKTGVYIVAAFMVLLVVGVIASIFYFGSPEL